MTLRRLAARFSWTWSRWEGKSRLSTGQLQYWAAWKNAVDGEQRARYLLLLNPFDLGLSPLVSRPLPLFPPPRPLLRWPSLSRSAVAEGAATGASLEGVSSAAILQNGELIAFLLRGRAGGFSGDGGSVDCGLVDCGICSSLKFLILSKPRLPYRGLAHRTRLGKLQIWTPLWGMFREICKGQVQNDSSKEGTQKPRTTASRAKCFFHQRHTRQWVRRGTYLNSTFGSNVSSSLINRLLPGTDSAKDISVSLRFAGCLHRRPSPPATCMFESSEGRPENTACGVSFSFFAIDFMYLVLNLIPMNNNAELDLGFRSS